MFDPNYDPALILEHTRLQVQQQQRSINQLITGHNQQDALMLELSEQLKMLLQLLNEHKRVIERQRIELDILNSILIHRQ